MYFDHDIVAVDFDGTLCANRYPLIGIPNDPLILALISQQGLGDKIILWTCRSGRFLDEAVEWCRERGLIFDAVNDNVPEAIAEFGGNSRKIYADYYIDDKGWPPFVPEEWEKK